MKNRRTGKPSEYARFGARRASPGYQGIDETQACIEQARRIPASRRRLDSPELISETKASHSQPVQGETAYNSGVISHSTPVPPALCQEPRSSRIRDLALLFLKLAALSGLMLKIIS